MKFWRVLAWAFIGLGMVLLLAFFLRHEAGSNPESSERLTTPEQANTTESATSPDEDEEITPSEQSTLQSQDAATEEPPLANVTAKERLFENAERLNAAVTRIGLSNRVVRRSLYLTDFKYPHILRREVVETDEDGEESIVKEELMVGDHVMVKLPEGIDEAAFEAWVDDNGYTIRHRLRTTPIVLVSSSNPGTETIEALQSDLSGFFLQIGEDPLAQIIEPDYLHFPTATPNDPNYTSLWGLHNTGQSGGTNDADIDAPETWDVLTDASDVFVAVIDTGVDRAHADLTANMWTNPLEIAGNGVDDDNNGFIDDVNGWDFFDDDNDPTDTHSHGTHCAGTIGAAGNNGTGIVGVCWDVSMVGIRFLGPTGGSTSDAIESVNYATTLGVDLTSNSWGGGGFSAALLQAIENGGSEEILFIAAAGNESVDTDVTPHYPSSYDSDTILSIAASDRNDDIASFSNWGDISVDLAAPGVTIYSTVLNGGYGNKNGTSMATPHVSGAAALLLALAPDLTHLELRQLLMQSVDPVPAFSQNTVTGGRLNLRNAMNQLGGPSLRMTQFTVTDTSGGNGNGIINPGEPVSIQIDIMNQGSENAENVTARLLREPSSVFSGGTGTLSLGTITPGQTIAVPTAFEITPSALTATPHDEELTVLLEWGPAPQQSSEFPVTVMVSTSSIISGSITTTTGAPLSGATIAYSGPVSGTVTTSSSGTYQISVIDGDYSIIVSAPGYADSVPRLVTVPPGLSGIDFSLGKPDLQVTPSSFSLNLFTGQTVTRTLNLTNNGDAALNWSLSSSQGATTSAIRVLPSLRTSEADPDATETDVIERIIPAIEMPASDLSGARIGLIASWSYPSFELDLTQRGAQVDNLISFPLATDALDNFDVLLIDDAIGAASATDISRLRTWIENGGGLLMMGDNSGSIANMNSVLSGTGIVENYRGTFDSITITDIATHPTTEDVTSVYSSQSGTYLTLSGDATSLMREPGGFIHAASGNLGAGSIIAIGNELISSGSLNTGDTRLFANQVVDWLNSGVSWITLSTESGTIAPGSSIAVDFEVNTIGLDPGSYAENLIINSNDPVSPQVSVPVNLQIIGAPSLSIVPSSLQFPDTLAGQATTESVTLRNVGTDELAVTGLIASPSPFTVLDTPPLVIPPGSETDISIRFAPNSVGSFAGLLTITSNDPANPTASIQINGVGLSAPRIGGRVTQISGGAAVGNATITYTGPTSGSLTTDANGDYSFLGIAGTYSLTASAPNFSSETQTITVPPDQLAVDFALGSPQISVNPGSFNHTMRAGDTAARTATIRNTGNTSLHWTSSLDGPASESISLISSVRARATAGVTLAEEGVPSPSTSSGHDWITFDPPSGSVSAGGQSNVLLEFDSAGLNQGTYYVEWTIHSNDTDTQQVVIPLTLNVTNAPNLEVTPLPTLSFPDTHTGQVSLLTATISNTGSENLIITSLNSSAPQFTVQSTLPLVINPGSSQQIPITFAPDAGGAFAASLNIVSNDTTGGSVSLGLAGSGISAPSFTVNPDSLDLVLVQGETLTETLEIENRGAENLSWTATIPEPGDLSPIYDVDWDGPPHVVGQVTATGGANAPTAIQFGAPTVRQALGDMLNRPLELAGNSSGSLNYGQIRFNMGGITEKVVLEFDLQKLDSDTLTILFDAPQVNNTTFYDTYINFLGFNIPYTRAAVNRIRIEFDIDNLTASLSLNGEAPVTRTLSSSTATSLSSIRFSANDQGTVGGTLIDNVTIGSARQSSTSNSYLPESSWLSMDPLSGTVSPGQQLTTTATIDGSLLSVGSHSTTIEFESNDPVNPAFSLPVTVTVLQGPEIEIRSPSGSVLTDAASEVTFSPVAGASSLSQSITISNTGDAPLTGLSASIDGTNADDFVTSGFAVSTLQPGQATQLVLTFDPLQLGSRVAILRIVSNDADENPFDITLGGTAIPGTPEIEIETPTGLSLVAGISAASLPPVTGSGASELILTVRNSGTAELSNLNATIAGTNAGDFTSTGFSVTELGPDENTDLRLTFTPNEAGTRVATLNVASNDADENPFTITIQGIASPSVTSVQSWAESHGLSGDAALPTADDDGDSLSLLEEYAYNLDPNEWNELMPLTPGSGESGLPLIHLDGDHLRIEYVRRVTDTNLNYRVVFGNTLSNDTVAGLEAPAESETVTPIDVDWERVIVTDTLTTATTDKRFATLIVEEANP